MKKKSIGFVMAVLIVGFLVIGCDDPGTAPIINKFFAADSLQNIENGIEKKSFKIGDIVYLGVGVNDPDLDVVSMTVSMVKSEPGQTSETVKIPIISSMPYPDTLLFARFWQVEEGEQGNWFATVFVTDSKGNESNTMRYEVTFTD